MSTFGKSSRVRVASRLLARCCRSLIERTEPPFGQRIPLGRESPFFEMRKEALQEGGRAELIRGRYAEEFAFSAAGPARANGDACRCGRRIV